MSDLNILLLMLVAILPPIAMHARERFHQWRLRRRLRYSRIPKTSGMRPVFRERRI